MTIQFCGAAQEVTGSAHLLTLDDGYKILLDCGLYQGSNKEMKDFNQHFLFDPAEVDCLILSHAHIDHTGRVPKLVKDGFQGSIYATHATRSLCSIMLLDSAYIQEKDAEYYNKKHPNAKPHERWEPLYETKHVQPALDKFVGLPYNKWQYIHPQVELQYRDSGHILGSASVNLRITRANGEVTSLSFTGDIGRPNRPILRDPDPMPMADYIICESTYGDRFHESAPHELEKFLRIIQRCCVENKGKMLIPAFSVGRTQEIVYMLDQLANAGRLPKIPVYVDSPLAVNATLIFGTHPECYDSDLQDYMLTDDDPFGFNGLTYVRSAEASKALNHLKGPAIIISASGMLNAGRSKHHLRNIMGKAENTIFIVGYASPETPGGKIREGAKGLKLFGQYHELKAQVETMDSFSAHGDQAEMIDYLQGQEAQCKKIFLVHGTLERQEVFKAALQKAGFGAVEIPQLEEKFTL